eukprot:TRINITY_DN6106_c0_g1_i1.p1 TRINITY_DN6106_c0_g1~~TRINITY_DN6106_c0_g1_i1.p1  ORF type:complete len:618 (+),score=204.00 TRINITY_DN6106_c0_g1_i1:258-1856(+)
MVASREGKNPLHGVVPHVPNGLHLGLFSKEFLKYEKLGESAIKGLCFVLVAGGLGERLGYNGIKIELPTNLVTGECYLEYYAQCIQALQDRSGVQGLEIPLVIMTSGDTHDKTTRLLKAFGNFGLSEAQVTLVKQEKVPTFSDEQGKLSESKPYVLNTKPHGNGDVHLLLHQHGISEKWVAQGKQWIVFFQDTNGLAFNTVLPTLGLSIEANNSMTTVCVPRMAGEAIGCITKLVKENGSSVVCNVEYNQIDPLLRALSGGKQGDTADPATGFSVYPGNTNTLVIGTRRYAEVLRESGGVMPEFVNPKYANSEKTKFKAPTRLECMMEDYPKLLRSEDSVGWASFDRWASFSPCKNSLVEAKAKADAGLEAWGAFSAETDYYKYHVELMKQLGCRVATPTMRTIHGVKAPVGALVWFAPSFGMFRGSFAGHFPTPRNVSVSSRSSLVVDGAGVTIRKLNLDGALVISACPGAFVDVVSLTVRNAGVEIEELDSSKVTTSTTKIRGYTLARHDQMVLRFSRPGRYVINDQAKL